MLTKFDEVFMLKIYGRANSINVRKVLWAAGEIGVPFVREDWGRGYRPTSDPEFQKVSAFGVVPVIDDGGVVVRESNTIVRYLASKHGRDDLYPQELAPRTRVDMWMDYGITDLYFGMRPLFQGKLNNLPPWNDPKLIAFAAEDWNKQFRRVDAELAAHGPYIAGSKFTVADIAVGMVANRWFSLEFEKPELPALAAYYERLSQRPPFREHGRNGLP